MDKTKKINTLIEVSKKYKIDEPKPYARVEYIHGKEHQVVEFEPTGEVHGTSWLENMGYRHSRYYGLKYFISGMLWGAVVAWLAMILRGL